MIAHPDEVRAGALHRLVRVDRPVRLVDVHDPRRVRRELGFVVDGVGDDDDAVTRLHEPRRGPVENDVAWTAFHRVGLEAGTVVDVEHGDLLELPDVGELHQRAIERDGTDVLEVRAGDRGAVDLRLHHRSIHIWLPGFAKPSSAVSVPCITRCPRSACTSTPGTDSVTLSIRRVLPTRAASATSTSASICSTGTESCAGRTL